MINILKTRLIDYTVRLIEEKDFQALYELEKNNTRGVVISRIIAFLLATIALWNTRCETT